MERRYKKQAAQVQGDRLKSDYRLWIMDNADHDPKGPTASAAVDADKPAHHIVSYEGEYEQAFLYLNEWVSKGTPPPTSTQYRVTDESQIELNSTTSRDGVQPLVALSSDQQQRVDVKVGEPVNFQVRADVPSGAGKIVNVEWDLLGTRQYVADKQAKPVASLTASKTGSYERPGTYFPTVRISSKRDCGEQCQGMPVDSPYATVQNLGAMRVIVH